MAPEQISARQMEEMRVIKMVASRLRGPRESCSWIILDLRRWPPSSRTALLETGLAESFPGSGLMCRRCVQPGASPAILHPRLDKSIGWPFSSPSLFGHLTFVCLCLSSSKFAIGLLLTCPYLRVAITLVRWVLRHNDSWTRPTSREKRSAIALRQ